ncbi:sulfurtransferase complex subunit TusC [Rodentibacter caecimuris]|uniref:Sulfurtransferase TusC n=1 Tax=Rodentibacter caecimuris TaxID=1796644 RepID=A0ABX3KYW0_9PAST|nr:sulfurtransferase TusC [Rodentibacter heylii]
MKIAFVFRSPPHGTSVSREALDALLAAAAFCDEREIGIFFIDDGVFNLLKGQKTDFILQKDFSRAFKLLDLYEIKQRFICNDSLERLNLAEDQLIISVEKVPRFVLIEKLKQAQKILTF